MERRAGIDVIEYSNGLLLVVLAAGQQEVDGWKAKIARWVCRIVVHYAPGRHFDGVAPFVYQNVTLRIGPRLCAVIIRGVGRIDKSRPREIVEWARRTVGDPVEQLDQVYRKAHPFGIDWRFTRLWQE